MQATGAEPTSSSSVGARSMLRTTLSIVPQPGFRGSRITKWNTRS